METDLYMGDYVKMGSLGTKSGVLVRRDWDTDTHEGTAMGRQGGGGHLKPRRAPSAAASPATTSVSDVGLRGWRK